LGDFFHEGGLLVLRIKKGAMGCTRMGGWGRSPMWERNPGHKFEEGGWWGRRERETRRSPILVVSAKKRVKTSFVWFQKKGLDLGSQKKKKFALNKRCRQAGGGSGSKNSNSDGACGKA